MSHGLFILPLANLVAGLDLRVEPERSQHLLAVARESGGEYTPPGSATHLHELSLFGVHARGEDLENLTRNWTRVARNEVLGGKREGAVLPPDEFVEHRLFERGAALAILARPDLHPAETVKQAAQLCLRAGEGTDWLAHQRARYLLDQMKREGAEAPKCVS